MPLNGITTASLSVGFSFLPVRFDVVMGNVDVGDIWYV